MHPQSVNPATLAMLFRKEFELCRVKTGETIALLTDLSARPEYVGAAFAAATDLGADVYEMRVNSVPSWTLRASSGSGSAQQGVSSFPLGSRIVSARMPRWVALTP
jgi:2,5-dihydroxypyridine 5,6-dioxygenase